MIAPASSSSPKFFNILVLVMSCPRLSYAQKCLLLLLRHHQGNNDWAWPGVETLARELAMTVDAVMHRLSELVKLKVIRRKKPGARAKVRATHYQIVGDIVQKLVEMGAATCSTEQVTSSATCSTERKKRTRRDFVPGREHFCSFGAEGTDHPTRLRRRRG